MRVSRIEFEGYRRLADTATNIDGQLTAFVGFNEAGKTSLLRALAWFSTGGALAPFEFNRTRPPSSDDAAVVTVYFELDKDDKASFEHIELDNAPTSLVLYKKPDGNRIRDLMPRPRRPAKPFEEAAERLASARSRLARQFSENGERDSEPEPTDEDSTSAPSGWADTVAAWLPRPDKKWSDDALDAVEELAAWLSQTPEGRNLVTPSWQHNWPTSTTS